MNSKQNTVFFYFVLIIISVTGCASNLTMQTAKALPEGVLSVGGAVALASNRNLIISQYNGRPDIESKKDDSPEGEPVILPWFMLGYGLGSGFDISLNLTPYALEGGFKYQILNVGDFFLASGVKTYYGYLPDIIDGNEPGIHSFDVILPLYLSYDLTSKYSVYGSVKYIFRNIHTSRGDEYLIDDHPENSPRHLLSGTLGNKFRNSTNSSIMLELCVNKDLGINYYSAQFNMGATKEY